MRVWAANHQRLLHSVVARQPLLMRLTSDVVGRTLRTRQAVSHAVTKVPFVPPARSSRSLLGRSGIVPVLEVLSIGRQRWDRAPVFPLPSESIPASAPIAPSALQNAVDAELRVPPFQLEARQTQATPTFIQGDALGTHDGKLTSRSTDQVLDEGAGLEASDTDGLVLDEAPGELVDTERVFAHAEVGVDHSLATMDEPEEQHDEAPTQIVPGASDADERLAVQNPSDTFEPDPVGEITSTRATNRDTFTGEEREQEIQGEAHSPLPDLTLPAPQVAVTEPVTPASEIVRDIEPDERPAKRSRQRTREDIPETHGSSPNASQDVPTRADEPSTTSRPDTSFKPRTPLDQVATGDEETQTTKSARQKRRRIFQEEVITPSPDLANPDLAPEVRPLTAVEPITQTAQDAPDNDLAQVLRSELTSPVPSLPAVKPELTDTLGIEPPALPNDLTTKVADVQPRASSAEEPLSLGAEASVQEQLGNQILISPEPAGQPPGNAMPSADDTSSQARMPSDTWAERQTPDGNTALDPPFPQTQTGTGEEQILASGTEARTPSGTLERIPVFDISSEHHPSAAASRTSDTRADSPAEQAPSMHLQKNSSEFTTSETSPLAATPDTPIPGSTASNTSPQVVDTPSAPDGRVVETVRPRRPRPVSLTTNERSTPAEKEPSALEEMAQDTDGIERLFRAWRRPEDRFSPQPEARPLLRSPDEAEPAETPGIDARRPTLSESPAEGVRETPGTRGEPLDTPTPEAAPDAPDVLFRVWRRPEDQFVPAPSAGERFDPGPAQVPSASVDQAAAKPVSSQTVSPQPIPPRLVPTVPHAQPGTDAVEPNRSDSAAVPHRTFRPALERDSVNDLIPQPDEVRAETQTRMDGFETVPVAETTRRFLRPLVGIDPDEGRVHRGPLADAMANRHQADAVTFGRDIFVSSENLDGDPRTQALLAHELTHVARNLAPRFVPPIIRGEAKEDTSHVASSQFADANPEEGLAERVEARVLEQAQTRLETGSPFQADVAEFPNFGTTFSNASNTVQDGLAVDSRELHPGQREAPMDAWNGLPKPWEPMPKMDFSGPSTTFSSGFDASPFSSGGEGVMGVQAASRERSLEPRTAPSTNHGDGGHEEQGGARQDLDALARQVYAILKRRLEMERRRGF